MDCAVPTALRDFMSYFADSMPLDEKLELVKSTLAELRRLSEEDLSPVNLAVIMHRAARLADHPALKAADGAVRTSSQGSLAHVTFIAGLLEKAVALVREKGQEADAAEAAAGGLGNISDRSLPAESRAWVPSAEEVGLATTALFAASLVGVRVSEEDVDALAMALVRGRQRWESRHVVMALVALGRLGAIPLEGQVSLLQKQFFAPSWSFNIRHYYSCEQLLQRREQYNMDADSCCCVFSLFLLCSFTTC